MTANTKRVVTSSRYKICSVCKIKFIANLKNFVMVTRKLYPDRVYLQSYCRGCRNVWARDYYKTKKGRAIKQAGVKRNHQKLRKAVLIAYSQDPPTCKCCGDNHVEFLSIDHINGGGVKHRKLIAKHPSGTAFYRWLNSNNFPKGFRVLCHNCNQSRGFYGYCPHDK